mmetsp:Transcript_6131/g.11210  ORF Transcript_6131/g.11210 Transcript_6131/m.11210 type:complete len:122 (+) Transcript_6131:1785-2150(+)
MGGGHLRPHAPQHTKSSCNGQHLSCTNSTKVILNLNFFFLLRCWHADPSQRPTADEIVEDLQSVLEKSMKMEFECVEVSHPSYEGVSFPSSTSMQSLQKGLYQEDLQNIRKTEELRTPREA